jgi:hypothetical protein
VRAPARRALLGAARARAAPVVPMATNRGLVALTDNPDGWTCSLVAIARESFDEPGEWRRRLDRGERPGGCGLRMTRELASDQGATPSGLDGRLECVAFFAIAVLAAAGSVPRWTRHAWIVGVLVAVAAGWTWWALRSGIVAIVLQLPGGLEGLRGWIRPWPFVLAGWAALSLGIASAWTRREARRARAADRRVPEVFE